MRAWSQAEMKTLVVDGEEARIREPNAIPRSRSTRPRVRLNDLADVRCRVRRHVEFSAIAVTILIRMVNRIRSAVHVQVEVVRFVGAALRVSG
ncbi:hypothetical protein RPC_2978 [Rhodopseudomonas palustris BisB18]|uniref:Uncharacterized protein n=1 Tax=Rhodopseudomonas palustris (strain BisB18) TaxID=316056 RepID=Q213B3_RHOPB